MSNVYDIMEDSVVVNAIVASEEFMAANYADGTYTLSVPHLKVAVRAERDRLLLGVDAVADNPLRWAALSSEAQTLWSTYRTSLLGVPQQEGFPTTVAWPTKPE